MQDDRPNRSWPRWLLRSADQAAVAGLAAFALGAIVLFWLAHGGHRGDLVEIDRVDPRQVEFLVDVNEANWPELTVLPEIGETLAKRIVEYRRQNGEFQSIDQLQRVQGIGPKTYERLKPYIRTITPESAVAEGSRR